MPRIQAKFAWEKEWSFQTVDSLDLPTEYLEFYFVEPTSSFTTIFKEE